MSAPNEGRTVLLERTIGDYKVTLSITPDQVKAFLQCEKLNQESDDSAQEQAKVELSTELLSEVAAEKIPSDMLDSSVIADLADALRSGKESDVRRISKGRLPKPGRDGKVLLLVKPYDNKANEYVDLRFIKRFDNIETGNIVGRIYPPTKGESGLSALGEPLLAAEGKPVAAKLDKTLTLEGADNNSFQEIKATNAGYLERKGDSLGIVETLSIKGDIDFRAGDVDFVGAVDISGNVMKGFTVIARRDITIKGDVVGGRVASTHGSISIAGRVTTEKGDSITLTESASLSSVKRLGSSSATSEQIVAFGNIAAQVIDGSSVRAGGVVSIGKEIRDAKIRAGSSIEATKASLISGSIFAVCGVEAKTLGSDAGARLVIRLCSTVESTEEFVALSSQIHAHESAEEVLKLYLGPYADSNKPFSHLHSTHRLQIEASQHKLKRILSSKVALLEKRDLLLQSADYNSLLQVNVMEKMFPGVEIWVGEKSFRCDTLITGKKSVHFDAEKQAFSLDDYSELLCDFTNEHE